MKNAKLFIFIFIFSFIFMLFLFCSDVKAFTFKIGNTTYDTDNLDIDLLEYNLVFNNGYGTYYILSSNYPAYFSSAGHFFINDNNEFSDCIVTQKIKPASQSRFGETTTHTRFVMSSMKNSLLAHPEYILYLDYDLKDEDGNVVIASQVKHNPYIVNKDEISTGKFDKIVINAGDYNTFNNQEFYFFSYYYSENSIDSIFPRKEIRIGGLKDDIDTYGREFLVGNNEKGNYIYEIPLSVTNVDLVEGNKYGFRLAVLNSDGNYEYIDNISFTIGTVSIEEKEQADRDKQLELQKEQNETNKGIFDTLKDVLSYINPLSENFFVYKLIELLVEAIKGLFLPSDDFFVEWATDVNDWLSDRLGILYYPVDLLVDFLTRINNLPNTRNCCYFLG